MESHKTEKLLYGKVKNKQSEEEVHRIGKDILQLFQVFSVSVIMVRKGAGRQLGGFAATILGWILCSASMGLPRWRVWGFRESMDSKPSMTLVGMWKTCVYHQESNSTIDRVCYPYTYQDTFIPLDIRVAQHLLLVSSFLGVVAIVFIIVALWKLYSGKLRKKGIHNPFIFPGILNIIAGSFVFLSILYNYLSIVHKVIIVNTFAWKMKYSPTTAALPQPPGSRNQESRHIRLSVLKAAVLVHPKDVTVIGNINGGGTSRLSWKSHPLQIFAMLNEDEIGCEFSYIAYIMFRNEGVMVAVLVTFSDVSDSVIMVESTDSPHAHKCYGRLRGNRVLEVPYSPLRMQIDPYLLPFTKLKSRWIKDLNIKPDTLNLIEEKLGNSLECTGTEDNILNTTPIAQMLRSTINKWDIQKLKGFCKAKDTAN
ncbi:hypothetical protein STEG23_034784 [Scotinomys teguina]